MNANVTPPAGLRSGWELEVAVSSVVESSVVASIPIKLVWQQLSIVNDHVFIPT